jgi:hypothetical protein
VIAKRCIRCEGLKKLRSTFKDILRKDEIVESELKCLKVCLFGGKKTPRGNQRQRYELADELKIRLPRARDVK